MKRGIASRKRFCKRVRVFHPFEVAAGRLTSWFLSTPVRGHGDWVMTMARWVREQTVERPSPMDWMRLLYTVICNVW